MYSRRAILSLIIFLISFGGGEVFAHPLDISSTTLTIHGDRASGLTYFHPFEGEYLLRKNGITFQSVADFYAAESLLFEYFRSNFRVIADSMPCTIQDIRMPPREAYEVVTSGIPIEYAVLCNQSIDQLDMDVTFFTGFALQTNRVHLLDADGNDIFYKVGTQHITRLTYHANEIIQFVDTDDDGLSDEDERASNTDISNRDTDADFYTDYEEVTFGWDPRNGAISPGQAPRDQYPTAIPRPARSIAQEGILDTPSSGPIVHDLSSGTSGEGSFRLLMQKIAHMVPGGEMDYGDFLFVFGLTVALGFLHALGPGHAKALLSSVLVDERTSRGQAIGFALIFSCTHIIDIILLFLMMQVFMAFSDPITVMGYIQKISPILLMLLGSWLLYRALRPQLISHSCRLYQKKHIWILGIIAGLAPCSFGWSLFFFLFSLGKVAWIPGLIFGIGLGIFLCLVTIIFTIEYIRVRSYHRFHLFSRYSSILSASIILLIGLILMVRVLI